MHGEGNKSGIVVDLLVCYGSSNTPNPNGLLGSDAGVGLRLVMEGSAVGRSDGVAGGRYCGRLLHRGDG